MASRHGLRRRRLKSARRAFTTCGEPQKLTFMQVPVLPGLCPDGANGRIQWHLRRSGRGKPAHYLRRTPKLRFCGFPFVRARCAQADSIADVLEKRDWKTPDFYRKTRKRQRRLPKGKLVLHEKQAFHGTNGRSWRWIEVKMQVLSHVSRVR